MTDLSPAKVPIVSGINDQPLAPNFNNNGQGCNGAYFIYKFHTGLDLIEESLNNLEARLDDVYEPTLVHDGGDF